MSIRYDFYRQDGVFKHQNKVIVRPTEGQNIKSDQLFEEIQSSTSLTTSDLLGAVTALKVALSRHLLEGNTVHLEGLGYFSLSIEGDVIEKAPDHYQLKNPKVKDVRFRPEKGFVRNLNREAHFKANQHSCRSHKVLSLETIKSAIDQLMEGGLVFTPLQFAHAVGCSRTTAYTVLPQLVAQGLLKDVSTSSRHKLYTRA